MLRKPPETEEEERKAEDMRCSALGNSFHTNAVAALLDHGLSSLGLKERKGPQAIVASSLQNNELPLELLPQLRAIQKWR